MRMVAICFFRWHRLSAQTHSKGLMYVNVSVDKGPWPHNGKKNAAARDCMVELEARAGVEPTYTDLQSMETSVILISCGIQKCCLPATHTLCSLKLEVCSVTVDYLPSNTD
jgi:hypothetical protein